MPSINGCSSVGRAPVSKTGCREFEPLHPCNEIKEMASIKTYVEESYNELVNKVSWPTWAELQNSTWIVAIASVIIALMIFVMDFVFGINGGQDSIWKGVLGFFYELF